MALANTSGGSYDKNTVKNDNGTVLNAGNTGDSRLGNDLNVSDNSNSQGQSLKPVEKDGTGGSTTDSAGIAKASSSQPFAKNSSPSEWKMFGGNVASELQYRDYSGSVNDGATEVARGQVETRVYGSGELSEFNILSRPDTQISTGRTKSANAGQSAKFVAPKTGVDLTSSDFRPSRSNPGKINWNLGGIPQSVNYASKERGEFELPATPAVPARVARFTIDVNPSQPEVTLYNEREQSRDIDCTIDWGDGQTQKIVGVADPSAIYQTDDASQVSHTYATGGLKNVSISGKYEGGVLNLLTNGSVGVLKSVEDWGCLDIDSTGLLYVGIVLPYNNTFTRSWGQGAELLTTIPSGAPNIKSTNLRGLFYDAALFNSPINHWDVSNVTSFDDLLRGCYTFNQPLNNWDTSSVTTMSATFYREGTTTFAFDQDISSWDFSSLQDSFSLFYFATGLNLSPANYDLLLLRWLEQADSMPTGMQPHIGTSRYSAGSAAATARATLINTYGWTITDGGAV